MARICADRVIIFSIIGLVAWTVIGLPIYYSQQIPSQQWQQGGTAAQQQPNTSTQQAAPTTEPHSAKNSSETKAQEPVAPHNLSEIVMEWVFRFFELKLTDVLIVIFTAVLAIKTSGLFTETAGLRSAADQQARDMKESIVAANRSAHAAERALTELERPWIFVHISPRLKQRVRADTGEATALDEDTPIAVFDIANHGRMPAVIDGCHIELGTAPIELVGEQNVIIPFGMLQDQFHGAIGPGERKGSLSVDCPWGREYELLVNYVTGESSPVPVISQDEEFIFLIHMTYAEISGSRHESCFCWRFDRAVSYWVQYGGPKYNFQN